MPVRRAVGEGPLRLAQATGPSRPVPIIKPVDPDDPAVADVIADWKKTPGTVGIRIMMTKEAGRGPNEPGLGRILRAAGRDDLSVQMPCLGDLDAGAALIERPPHTRFILHHLAI